MQGNNKRRRPTIWKKERVQQLKTLRPTTSDKVVAKNLKTTVSSIRNAAFVFKVKKKLFYWDYAEEQFILKNWTVMTAEELAVQLKRTRWAVINKYRELTGAR
jgi:hypothetical protein